MFSYCATGLADFYRIIQLSEFGYFAIGLLDYLSILDYWTIRILDF